MRHEAPQQSVPAAAVARPRRTQSRELAASEVQRALWSHDGFRLLLIFAVAVAVVVSRRPDALLHPQFWAEDGTNWYADAHNLGPLHALVLPQDGYFQTAARLTAALSLLAPLRWAPLFFNAVAISLQVAPVVFLASRRAASIVRDARGRLLLGGLYLALPNSWEVDANITNAQWHLAILGILVVLAAPPRTWLGRAFDVATVALLGLSGPFAILLLPVALYRRRQTGAPWLTVLIVLLCLTATVQVTTVIGAHLQGIRQHAPLGASPRSFMTIVAGQVFIAGIAGQWGYGHLSSMDAWTTGLLPYIVGLSGFAVLAFALWRGPTVLRLFLGYTFLALAAALASPKVTDVGTQWAALEVPYGDRYFILPMLGWLAAVAWLVCRQGRAMAVTVAGVLVGGAFLLGASRDWPYPAFAGMNWAGHVAEYDRAAYGSLVSIPINPPGWTVELVKK